MERLAPIAARKPPMIQVPSWRRNRAAASVGDHSSGITGVMASSICPVGSAAAAPRFLAPAGSGGLEFDADAQCWGTAVDLGADAAPDGVSTRFARDCSTVSPGRARSRRVGVGGRASHPPRRALALNGEHPPEAGRRPRTPRLLANPVRVAVLDLVAVHAAAMRPDWRVAAAETAGSPRPPSSGSPPRSSGAPGPSSLSLRTVSGSSTWTGVEPAVGVAGESRESPSAVGLRHVHLAERPGIVSGKLLDHVAVSRRPRHGRARCASRRPTAGRSVRSGPCSSARFP